VTEGKDFTQVATVLPKIKLFRYNFKETVYIPCSGIIYVARLILDLKSNQSGEFRSADSAQKPLSKSPRTSNLTKEMLPRLLSLPEVTDVELGFGVVVTAAVLVATGIELPGTVLVVVEFLGTVPTPPPMGKRLVHALSYNCPNAKFDPVVSLYPSLTKVCPPG
jgi:hypothetical protein